MQQENAPKLYQTDKDILQNALRRWKTKGDNAEEVIAICVMELKIFNERFCKPANIPLPFDPEILIEVINKDKGFNTSLEVRKDRRIMGITLQFLVLFGCPLNQAIKALMQWKNVGETGLKEAHRGVMKEEARDTVGFFFRNLAVVESFIEKAKVRPFPLEYDSYPKARVAFERLKLVCQGEIIAIIRQQYIYNKPLNYKAMYDHLSGIFPGISKTGNFTFPTD
ncbi:MAG TPA: hypothetical protein VFT64_12220 [Rickettsiales bacterium]|nr:hypothetical protein [Rickettsiales bacterium]